MTGCGSGNRNRHAIRRQSSGSVRSFRGRNGNDRALRRLKVFLTKLRLDAGVFLATVGWNRGEGGRNLGWRSDETSVERMQEGRLA